MLFVITTTTLRSANSRTFLDVESTVRQSYSLARILSFIFINPTYCPTIVSPGKASPRDHYMEQETNAAQAGDLATYELIGGGWSNSNTFLERIRAVTPQDVQRVAQKYMHNLRFVVLGDPARIDKNVFTVQLGG